MGGEIKGVDLAVLKQPSITAVENALNALNVGQAELARLLNARIAIHCVFGSTRTWQ